MHRSSLMSESCRRLQVAAIVAPPPGTSATGAILGLLDAGVTLGPWSRAGASRVADGIYHGASPRALRGMLRPLR